MNIISISLDEETHKELDRMQKRLGFSSRSKLMRATLGSMLNEYKVLEELEGHCDAVFTLTHDYRNDDKLSRLLLKYGDIIRTDVHQHHAGAHLRVLIICGNADRIRELFSTLKTERGVRSLSVSVL